MSERKRNHVKYPAFENWLSARFRYLLGYRSRSTNLLMTCWIWQKLVHVGLMVCYPRATYWTPSPLCTFADYSWVIIKDTLWHLTLFHWNVTETKWQLFCRRYFQTHFLQSKCLHFYQYFAALYSHGSNVLFVICMHFSRCYIFGALVVVIQKVLTLPLNHKDIGMRCNEGLNVWSSNSMYYQSYFCKTIAFARIRKYSPKSSYIIRQFPTVTNTNKW